MNRLTKKVSGVICLECGWIGVSWWVHDYKTCDCENRTMIDGGQENYVRYGGKLLDKVQFIYLTPQLVKKEKKK